MTSNVVLVLLIALGLVTVVRQVWWLRRHPPTGSRIGRSARGRMLVIGGALVFAGVGGLLAKRHTPTETQEGRVLWPVTNHCSIPLAFTSDDGSGGDLVTRRIAARAVGALSVRSGAEVVVQSGTTELVVRAPDTDGPVGAEWDIDGDTCAQLEPAP